MLDEIASSIGAKGNPWTGDTHLPGGDFPIGGMNDNVQKLRGEYPFLDQVYLSRLMRTYGTRTRTLLQGMKEKKQLGEHFGGQLFQKEVEYLIDNEWARSEEDILFRRTKQGIKFSPEQTAYLAKFVQHYVKSKMSKS